jgi:hypothetical protein
MVAVAIVALLMGAGRLLWLRWTFQVAALAHAANENLARVLQEMVEDEGKDERELEIAFGMSPAPEPEAVVKKRAADAAMNRKTAEYHAALKRKCERAARYPWLPVQPDPPPPL